MKVLKFGGTSVGSTMSIQNVKQIVEACSEHVIVVVSAMGGVTDQLLSAARMAAQEDKSYETLYRQLFDRHIDMIEQIIPDGERKYALEQKISAMLGELKNILQGVFLIGDLSSKTSDTVVSYGERLSSLILSEFISGSVLYDARKFIKTTQQPHTSAHIPDADLTQQLIVKTFRNARGVSIVPGFIATDKQTGEISNLGRGGSDYTAAIIAAALNADVLEIWTDVDGFMTADPKVIRAAYPIAELSYIEAMELCNFGAKVIYPPTIYPVLHKNIPILIKNTFNPTVSGTCIHAGRRTAGESLTADASRKAIKGISSINNTTLLTLQGLGMVGIVGVNKRIFTSLADGGISVFFVSQASSENSTSLGVKTEDAALAQQLLDAEFAKEIERGEMEPAQAESDLATVAIVGEYMKHTPGIAGKLFGTLGRNGINVIACAQGASETNISFVINSSSLRKALNVIHDSFFLSDYKVLNVFVCGKGTVGDSLLKQIDSQQEELMKKDGLRINVVGIADSRHYLLNRDGLSLSDYRSQLKTASTQGSIRDFVRAIIETNIFNSVFVDCTASADVASVYRDLLQHNISVVAANKLAASSDYKSYTELKEVARQRDVKFLFETNVGAGLPIINTMGDLIHSGDRILRIEAVLSGTLNFIFNTLSKEVPLSKAISMAKEAGYSEPDPRIDLSGTDVIRKIVILAREAGYQVEQSDVKTNLFIPNDYFAGSLEEFWQRIPALDEQFESDRKQLEKENKRWRFVAKMDKGEVSVQLTTVDNTHPFYHLEGSNNIILLTTERYHEYPLLIQGYGAGAGVTAAGVFADIISIANI